MEQMTMATAIKAIYEHGVFKPVTPVRLKEETEVEVIVPPEAAAEDDDPTGWKAMREFIGLAKDADTTTAFVDHDAIAYRRCSSSTPASSSRSSCRRMPITPVPCRPSRNSTGIVFRTSC
jgi:predicted DNA-binding antitoxin AbrB/MazE fold protein